MKRLTILFLAVFAFIGSASAQMNPMSELPADPELRKGQLENGLTYYIRHNEKPKGQADFYILHNVGAIQEADTQQGLAHFLEHMAFNGTKNLPGKALIEYLETIGVKFGANLNAGTSWDYTLYNIADVPTSRQGIIDTVMLALHDWSHFIALEPKEIDSERGVIMEELRTRDGAQWRSTIDLVKSLGKGTRYEHRNLIGYLDDLKSFQHAELETFYNTWYRPDYQAIIVVGDIDVDYIENKLKELMADVPAPAENAPKKDVIVPTENEEPIVTIFTDKEMQGSQASLYIKHQATPNKYNNTIAGITTDLCKSFISVMGSQRMQEISTKPNAPFLAAQIGVSGIGIMPTLESFSAVIMTEDGKLNKGLEALFTEVKRIKNFGFTVSEFERAQQDILRMYEKYYNNRNDKKNNDYVQNYISNYRNNTPVMDAETEWQIYQALVNQLNVDIINKFVKEMIFDKDQVIFIAAPEKEGVVNPAEEDVLAIRSKVMNSEVEAYEDNTVKEPLISENTKFKGSKVKKTIENKEYGTTEWVLKNGARIIVKPTNYKADEILFDAYAQGGKAILTEEEALMGNMLPALNMRSGVSKFSMSDLNKQLSGKSVNLMTSLSDYEHGFVGNCSPKDVETLLQLIYLNFTQPRFNEDDYNILMTMLRSQMANMKSNPNYLFQEEISKTLYGNNPRRNELQMEDLDKFKFSEFPEIYSKLYPGANGFTFVFTGNVDMETLRPLVEKYIGSIPRNKKAFEYTDDNVRFADDIVKNDFKVAMEQPKVSVFYNFHGDIEYNIKNALALEFLSEALNSRYLISIREEKGGTYGVQTAGQMLAKPISQYSLLIVFDTNEEMADELMDIIMAEIQKIAKDGPLSEDIEKHREYLLKNWPTSLEQNESWRKYIKLLDKRGVDYVADYEKAVKDLTYEDVQNMAKRILEDNNMTQVIMRPKAK